LLALASVSIIREKLVRQHFGDTLHVKKRRINKNNSTDVFHFEQDVKQMATIGKGKNASNTAFPPRNKLALFLRAKFI